MIMLVMLVITNMEHGEAKDQLKIYILGQVNKISDIIDVVHEAAATVKALVRCFDSIKFQLLFLFFASMMRLL